MEPVTVTVTADRAPGRPQEAPGALAAFARFVLCGGGVGLASSVAVAALAAWLPWALANAVITVVSTLLATELHARFTFGAGGRATWRQHTQSAGSAAAAYAATCAAMLALHQLVAAPGAVLEQIVYLSASALAGVARFAVLRLVVFARGRTHPAATGRATEPGRTHSSPDASNTARAVARSTRSMSRCSAVPPRVSVPEVTEHRASSASRYHSGGLATSVAGSSSTRPPKASRRTRRWETPSTQHTDTRQSVRTRCSRSSPREASQPGPADTRHGQTTVNSRRASAAHSAERAGVAVPAARSSSSSATSSATAQRTAPRRSSAQRPSCAVPSGGREPAAPRASSRRSMPLTVGTGAAARYAS